MLSYLKIGFLGAGAVAQNLIQGFLNHSSVKAENIFLSLRSAKKRKKAFEGAKINILLKNEELLEESHVVFLCVKPHDLPELLNELQASWRKEHTILSPVAGVRFKQLRRWGLNSSRVIRFMPNINVCVGEALLPFCSLNNQENLNFFFEELLAPLGKLHNIKEEQLLSALTVACASGPGFILEMMQYWREWLSEQGFHEEQSKDFVTQTFLGTSLTAQTKQNKSFSDLQKEICSKKGVTAEGLKNLREMEMERLLRLSFEKSLLKLKEIEES